MQLLGSDPDVETLVTRIRKDFIDLRPNFQRGEVWSKAKKQRLIDSILRNWHVPPIHVVEVAESKVLEVLDGQQRLVAIRDFAEDQFAVDATIEPLDPRLADLNGKTFSKLPPEWKQQFNQFTIRLYKIVQYTPAEPGELFFRLNQPTSLTGAEQRNAFFGPVREQVKALVKQFESAVEGTHFGFKNTRMAYDDVVARVGLAIDRRTIAEKITANDLVDLYRREVPFEEDVYERLEDAISQLCSVTENFTNTRFNKATLFSWLIFLIRRQAEAGAPITSSELSKFLYFFEMSTLKPNDVWARLIPSEYQRGAHVPFRLQSIYGNRSSSRVADVSSVLLRDAIIWLFYAAFNDTTARNVEIVSIDAILNIAALTSKLGEDELVSNLLKHGWGRL